LPTRRRSDPVRGRAPEGSSPSGSTLLRHTRSDARGNLCVRSPIDVPDRHHRDPSLEAGLFARWEEVLFCKERRLSRLAEPCRRIWDTRCTRPRMGKVRREMKASMFVSLLLKCSTPDDRNAPRGISQEMLKARPNGRRSSWTAPCADDRLRVIGVSRSTIDEHGLARLVKTLSVTVIKHGDV